MNDRESYDNDARFLAEMMAPGAGESALGRPQELSAILRHQLDAPLALDLESLGPESGQRVDDLSRVEGPPIRTFRDLLSHPNPPVELLEMTKQFAKDCVGRSDATVPEKIADVLYTLSIVVAVTRCGRRITELEDQYLQRRIDWALAQPWLDEMSRDVLLKARPSFETASGKAAEDTHAGEVPEAAQAAGSIDRQLSMSALHASLGQLGEYTLLEKLGEGGMGTVYKALHTELDRLVAIKVMRKGPIDEEWAVSRFRREIKAIGSLDHPNIVRAHDARKIGDTHFLVMEYVGGLDLSELVKRLGSASTVARSLRVREEMGTGTLPHVSFPANDLHGSEPVPILSRTLRVEDACELVRQAALGLQCAHEHGLVHRDIKPSNLMLNRQGQVKILDLGLARIHAPTSLGSEMTTAGQVMGTPDYMAPEQISDSHAVDIRADIYSLGCTLFMLLTGRPPFSGPEYQDLLSKLTAHRERTPPPVGRFRGDVPAEVIAVLDRMLAKTPEGRFATPAEVAHALDPWARGCDLCGLLATVESSGMRADTSDVRIASSAGGSPAVSQGAGVTGLAGTPGPLQPTDHALRSGLPRRRSWMISVGLLLMVLAGGIALTLMNRVGREEGPVAASGQQGRKDTQPQDSPKVALAPAVPSGWIVMSWTRPRMGKPNLWLFSPDGMQRLNITNDPRYFDIHPKFSPDARRIAFIRCESLTEPNGVYMCKADGSELRGVVTAGDSFERFASPVWVSNSRLYYSRDPKADREPDMELWCADLDGSKPRLVGRFQDIIGKGDGLVTDVSPDGRHLAIIAQSAGSPATSDVYVTDLEGKNVQTVWVDRPDEWRDARALWSPDGTRMAWHHNFARGVLGKPIHHGVGMARRGADGSWAARLQPQAEIFVTPLAWSPRGDYLLCARMHDTGQRLPPVTLFLMDDGFRSVRDLCELEATPWQPAQRDLGRLADWAIVPDDMRIGAAR